MCIWSTDAIQGFSKALYLVNGMAYNKSTKTHRKFYKKCAVPLCHNKSNKNPQKLFIYVPIQKERRNEWFRVAGFDKPPTSKNVFYCEDHFDMPNDMRNFTEYEIKGSVSHIRMNLDCVPSKFDCQTNRKRLSDLNRPSTEKRQGKSLIGDCVKDEDQNQDLVGQRCEEDNEVPNGCSDKLIASRMMEVIDLDCDDTVSGNNESQSGINTKESNVSSTSTCNADIDTETTYEENTENKQANLTPGTSSSLDLDKFKRRLIRVIARSLVIEKKPENTFWTELKKVTTCDCRLLWTRMRAVTIKKLKRLFAVEDKAQNITKIARLSVTDWLLIDLVLVHEKVDVIGQDEDDSKDKNEPKTLEYLFKLVLKHNTEKLSGDKLTEAWYNAANDYNKRGRFCSPMLLQRRWYQLKELVWYNFYNFWFSYRGDIRNLQSAGRFKPTPLQMEIIKYFNKIVTEPFQTWEELIEQKKVVLLEDFERYELALKKGTNTGQENEPDLVVIEPHVDTIDLRLEPDSDSDSANATNEVDKTTENSKINLSIVKNETIEEISDGDDVSMLEAVDIPLKSLKLSNVTINENNDTNYTKNDNVVNINDNTTISKSDEMISDSDEEIIDHDDEDAVILDDSNDTTTSLETKHAFKEEAEGSNSTEYKKNIILDVDVNKSNEKNDNYINSAGNSYHYNIASQKITNVSGLKSHQNKEERVIHDIKDIKTDEITKLHQDTADITNVQGLLTNLISDIKKETSNLPEKQNILYDVTSNLGVYMNGLELEDDGIEYFEEDDDDDATVMIDNTENKVEENCTTNKKDPPKIDLKLLLQTVVYTKRLNDMDVFRFIDYKSVKDARIINEAIIESIPVHKKSFKMEDISEYENSYKSDMSDADASNDDEYRERINYKSWYFKKPKISTYNPIQLCKNPDFNTRLKRLTAGFFSSERNRRLLKECKPLTIDIYKSFETKLTNNSLMLDGFPSQTIKKEIIEPVPEPVGPTVLPTESLVSIENVLDSSKQCIPKMCDIPNQNIEVDPQIVGRNRIISLPDIDQIRRANEKLLIAEVTPIQVSSTSSKPPVEILQHTANIQSIKEQERRNKKNNKIQNIERSLPRNNNIINVDIPQPSVAQKGYNIPMLEPETERMDLEIEILQHTANIQSIKDQECRNKKNNKIQNIERSLPRNNNIINVDIPQPSVAQKGYNIPMLEPETERMDLEIEILQHTANIQSIKDQECRNKKNNKIQNIERSLPRNNNIINVDIPQPSVAQKGYNILMLEPETERMDLEIETSIESQPSGLKVKKRKGISKTPPVKPKLHKNSRKIAEFVQKGIPTDRLLALDTIERILGICQYNVDPIKHAEMTMKNKTQKLRKNFLKKTNSCKQNKKNDMETGDVQDISIENNEDIVAKEISEKVTDNKGIDSTPIVAGGNAMENMNEFTNNNNGRKRRKRKNKKLPRTIYCCWAREKTLSLSKPHQRLLSAHTCSLPLCSCCCRDDYVKVLRKLHARRQNSLSVNNEGSGKEQSCELPKIIVEKVSRGINTDDNPEYALNLLEASKTPFDADANKNLPEQTLIQQKYYLSSETSVQTLDKVSQVQEMQTKDMHVDMKSGLNPIIMSVQSLSHTQPVVLEDVKQINNNQTKNPSSVQVKTNLLFSEGPCYLTPPKEQKTNVPERLSQLTVIVPHSKAFLLNKKLQKSPKPISLGKNKILLCSKGSKEEAEKQISEPIPPQIVMLNNDSQTSLEGVNLMLPPSQFALAVSPANVDPQNLNSISTTNSVPEQENTNNISNSTVASCNLRQNVNNENTNADNIESVEKVEYVSDKNTEDMATSTDSDTLTQSKFAVDINIKHRGRVTESSEFDNTHTIVSPTKLKTIENDKTSKQLESIPHKITDGSAKKTILSDLMEMSGISLEDITVNSESTELEGNGAGVSNNNTTEEEISNISPNPDLSATINTNLNMVTSDQFGTLSVDLNVVSSLYDLKEGCDKNKQFYKLNIETGEIVPINVSIKKHTKPKHKPILHNTVIDLTDDGEKEEETTSDSPPYEPKQSQVVRPLKLYRAVHPTLLRASGKSILRNPVISKEGLSQKKKITLKMIPDRKRKEQIKEVKMKGIKSVVKCYTSAKITNELTISDSDDEPLAFKAKRKKNDGDDDNNEDKSRDENRSEVIESLGASASATNTNEPEVNLNNPVLEPVVFNDSSDEDCILGV